MPDDELVPRDGKDEPFDDVMTEIGELETELDDSLKKFEKTVGRVRSQFSDLNLCTNGIFLQYKTELVAQWDWYKGLISSFHLLHHTRH